MTIPWIKKYAPKKISEVTGQETQMLDLQRFVRDHKKGGQIIFLYGGNGCGKTSSVYAVAEEKNLELIELNASDTRNTDAIERIIGGATGQMSLFGTSKLILIDEIEGISGMKDRGAIQSIIKITKTSSFPIIVIGADAYDDKAKAIRKESELIQFNTLSLDDVSSILKRILQSEKIDYDEKAIRQIARISGGDARAAINDLQTIASGTKKIDSDAISALGDRNTTKSIEDALYRIFKGTSPEVVLSAFDDISEDLDKIFLWVEENIPKEYLEPKSLRNAFDNLSLANVFYGRIRRWQYYRFYVYCYNLLSAGIAMSKEEKNPKKINYKASSRLLKIWIYNNANAKKKAIAQKVARKTHTSQKVAFHTTVPFIQAIFKKDKNQANALTEELDLIKEEVDWLKTK